jgi:2-iminoacetate synthase
MADFDLDTGALERQTESARSASSSAALWPSVRDGAVLDPESIAPFWHSSIATDDFYELVRSRRASRADHLETFSPLYMTNTCDAECLMCGMRRGNEALIRETAAIENVVEQLRILVRRGMRAVALLTGEYRAANRPWAMEYVNRALRATQELRFNHVLINVGSIDEEEFDTLLGGVERHADGSLVPKVSMSTFQETYSRRVYAKFMGADADNPRADYDRRLKNFDRAWRAGMRVANPGILVGLNPDVAFDLTGLVLHARHLIGLGMEVYLSVPRLRRIAGSGGARGIGDEDYIRLVALLALAVPEGKIVITTREGAAMQARLAPIVSVISAGSASVAPYTPAGARFPLETSQFEVIDQRPFEAILQERLDEGVTIENFEPVATPAP